MATDKDKIAQHVPVLVLQAELGEVGDRTESARLTRKRTKDFFEFAQQQRNAQTKQVLHQIAQILPGSNIPSPSRSRQQAVVEQKQQGVTEAQHLMEEAETLYLQTSQILLTFQQMADYYWLINVKLTAEQIERLKKDLEATQKLKGMQYSNVWFRRAEGIGKHQEHIDRLAKIAQRLKKMNDEAGSNEQHIAISSSLQKLESTQLAWKKAVNDNSLKELNNQHVHVDSWLKAPRQANFPAFEKTIEAKMAAIAARTLANKTDALSAQTLKVRFNALVVFVENTAQSFGKQFEQEMKKDNDAIREQTRHLTELLKRYRAADTLSEVEQIEAQFAEQYGELIKIEELLKQLNAAHKKNDLAEIQRINVELVKFNHPLQRAYDLIFESDRVTLQLGQVTQQYTDAATVVHPELVEEYKRRMHGKGLAKHTGFISNLSSLRSGASNLESLKEQYSWYDFNKLQKEFEQQKLTKQNQLKNRKKAAQQEIKEVGDLLAKELPSIDVLAKAEDLLNEIKQEKDLKKAMRLLVDMSKKISGPAAELIRLKNKMVQNAQELAALHSDDVSEADRAELIEQLRQYQKRVEEAELLVNANLAEHADELAAYIQQATDHIQERLRTLHKKYTVLQQAYTEMDFIRLADIVDVQQQNGERLRLKELAADARLLMREQETGLLPAHQIEDQPFRALQVELQDQLDQTRELIAEIDYRLDQTTRAQVGSSQAALAEIEDDLDQQEMEAIIAEAEQTGAKLLAQGVGVIALSAEDKKRQIAAAQHYLTVIQQARTTLTTLPNLDQLPANLSDNPQQVLLVDWRNRLLHTLDEYETRITLIAQGKFISLQNADDIKQEMTRVKRYEIIPTRQGLWSDAPSLKSFAQQQAYVGLQLAQNIMVLNRQLFLAIPEQEFEVLDNNSGHYRVLKQTQDKLSLYVKNDILKHESIDTRTVALERWILIMSQCHQEGDYQSAVTIYQALVDKDSVGRLESTFDGISPTATAKLNELNLLFSKEGDYERLRAEMAQRNTPVIPYLEAYRSQLDLNLYNLPLIEKPAVSLVTVFTKMQSKYPQVKSMEAGLLQEHLELLSDEPNIVDRLARDSLRHEPENTRPAPSILLRSVGDALWEENASVRGERVFAFLNSGLNAFQIDKQLRYHDMLTNKVLAEMVKNQILKSPTANSWNIFTRRSTAAAIRLINEATQKLIARDEMEKRLQGIGVTLTAAQMKLVEAENHALIPGLVDVERLRAESNTIVELPTIAPAPQSKAKETALTLKPLLSKLEINLRLDKPEEGPLSTDRLYEVSQRHLQDNPGAALDDLHYVVFDDKLADLEQAEQLLAEMEPDNEQAKVFQERLATIRQFVQTREELFARVIFPAVCAIGAVQNKLIISAERADLPQTLRLEETVYRVNGLNKADGENTKFSQFGASTFAYDLHATPSPIAHEQQLQKTLAHHLSDSLQDKDKFYVYGPTAVAKEMALRIYQAYSAQGKAIKVYVNDLPMPAASLASLIKKATGFFSKPEVSSKTKYAVEKIDYEQEFHKGIETTLQRRRGSS